MKIKKRIDSVRNFIGRFEPITSKILHDNIFAIAGQSAFFIILSAVPLSMFIVSILQNLHIPVDFIEMVLSGIFSEQIVDEIS